MHHGIHIKDSALGGRGRAQQPLHHRALLAGQGHRLGRRGRQQDQDGDRQLAAADRPDRTQAAAAADRAAGAVQGARQGQQSAAGGAVPRGARAARASATACVPSGCARRTSSRSCATKQRELEELRTAEEQARRAGRPGQGRRDSVRPHPRAGAAARAAPRAAQPAAGEAARTSRKRSATKRSRPSSPSGRACPSPRCSKARCRSSSRWSRTWRSAWSARAPR